MQVFEGVVAEIKDGKAWVELYNVMEKDPDLEETEIPIKSFNPTVSVGSIFYWFKHENEEKSKIVVDCSRLTKEQIERCDREAARMYASISRRAKQSEQIS